MFVGMQCHRWRRWLVLALLACSPVAWGWVRSDIPIDEAGNLTVSGYVVNASHPALIVIDASGGATYQALEPIIISGERFQPLERFTFQIIDPAEADRLTRLIRAMGVDDATARHRAMNEIKWTEWNDPSPAFFPLHCLTAHDNPETRALAVETLSACGAPVPFGHVYSDMLGSDASPEARAGAAWALGEHGDPAFLDALVRAASGAEPVLAAAIDAATARLTLPQLRGLIGTPEVQARQCTEALSRVMGTPPDKTRRRDRAVSIVAAAPPEMRRLLFDLLAASEIPAWRETATWTAARIHQLEAEWIAAHGKRSWGPEQATGAPDTPGAGDMVTAWASESQDGAREWLMLTYPPQIEPREVVIHETFNPGAVDRVLVYTCDGREIEVWKGNDPPRPGEARRTLHVAIATRLVEGDSVARVRIELDSERVAGWNEVDAVGLVDGEGRTHWATDAEASSTFAQPIPLAALQFITHAPEVVPADEPSSKRNWSPEQATGAPDTPQAGDRSTAWASQTPDGDREWLKLEYAEPVVATRIDVYETYNPGAVERITVVTSRGEVEVWRGKASVLSEGKRVFRIDVVMTEPIREVTLYLDSPAVPGWNEIDAVGLVEAGGKTHWATEATASGTYGQ